MDCSEFEALHSKPKENRRPPVPFPFYDPYYHREARRLRSEAYHNGMQSFSAWVRRLMRKIRRYGDIGTVLETERSNER